MLFNSIFGRKNSTSSTTSKGVKLNKKNHQPRSISFEPLESRDLLTVTTGPVDDAAYDEIRAAYPEFELPEFQADLNVMTITPDDGALSLADLKSAIATAETTEGPDLILVQTSADANSVTYASGSDELFFGYDISQYGSISIIGWGEEKFTIDANEQCSAISIYGYESSVNLGGLTIQNGKANQGGGIITEGYNLTLHVTNCKISDNYSTESGGGIYNNCSSSTLILSNCEISGNSARYSGGGVYNTGSLIVKDSILSGNSSVYSGGGILNGYNFNDDSEISLGTLTVTNSSIINNSSSTGGGICNWGNSTVINCDITENNNIIEESANQYINEYFGGGIFSDYGAFSLVDSAVSNNTGSYFGGGIYVKSGTMTITNSPISGNTAYCGGGVFNVGMLTITDCEISNNTAEETGGGILNGIDYSDSSAIKQGSLSITNGAIFNNSSSTGGGIYNSGDSTINNCNISDNTIVMPESAGNDEYYVNYSLGGGGIYSYCGSVTVTDSTISNNYGLYFGGGVYNAGGLFTLTDSQISRNSASSGGGIVNGDIYDSNNFGTLIINRCEIANNSSEFSGGGVCNFGLTTITDSNIAENTVIGGEDATESYGGGIYNSYDCRLEISNSSVVDNTIEATNMVNRIYGGGIYNASATLTISSSIISRNALSGNINVFESNGGGICNYYGHVTLTDSELSCNTNTNEFGANGGGVYSIGTDATLTITDCAISGNSADNYGGGIENVSYCTLLISSCEIIDNIAGNGGGGINNDGGTATITNSIISGNIAKGSSSLVGGGGIMCCGSTKTLTVTNCTIAGNFSYNDGGGIYNYYSKLLIYNSIVVGNIASNGNDLYKYNGTITGHNNLSSYTAWEESDNIVYDPNLPLFYNANDGDYQLASNSQAIDKGNNQYAYDAGLDVTHSDLNGNPRFNGAHIDLGAYEFSMIKISQRGVYSKDVLISWEEYENAASVRLTWIAGTTRTVLGTFDPVGEFTWDTTAYPNGYGLLKVEYLDENEKALFTSSNTSLILNSDDNVVVHRDDITESETWAADKVHLVVGQIVVKDANLIIENSAVVKFSKSSFIYVDSEATLTLQDNVVLTRVEDDSVGGDTNLDGDLTAPQFGNAYLRGIGTINIADSVIMKFITTTTSGIISVSEVWNSGQVYHVTEDVIIANGATLTILPGAIVKFDSGKSLIVQYGGTLNAHGTAAQPIVLTSIKDDQYGGDTNEDDGFYAPEAGDWNHIRVLGTANFDHAIIRYAGHVSDSYGAIYGGNGSEVTFTNSVLEFSEYYAMSSDSGSFTVINSVFRECLTALINMHSAGCSAQFINCTFADSSMFLWCGWGNTSFTNCIVANITDTFIGHSNSASFQNCVFYNPKDSGPQSFSFVGSNGNVWANPLFRNAAAGDYYLMAGSPCIDAGTSVGAPETDITGAPRLSDIYTIPTGIPDDNGEYFDIGAYEFTDNADSSIDLEPINVQAPDSVTSGENVTIHWTIRNNGSAAALGTWTDSIYLVNENSGQTVLVKEYVHPGSIAAGDLQTFYADVDIPAVVEGEWKVQIHVNPNREIFEGQANDNNIALSANAVIVSVPEILLPCNLIATHNGDTYKLHLNAGEVYYIKAEIPDYEPSDNAKAGIVLRAREGFVPTETSYDWISESVEYNQIVYTRYESVSSTIASSILYIPAGETDRDIYLNVSSNYSNSGKTCCLQRLSNELGLESVINSVRVIDQRSLDESDFTDSLKCSTPFDYGKQTTIEIFGTGFNEGMTALLSPGSRTSAIPADTLNEIYPLDTISASSVQILSATRALLTFDMPSWEYNDGVDYFNLVVSSNDAAITLSDLIDISSASSTNYIAKANLTAKLNLPETIRVGRIYEGSITYSSDAPGVIAPIFILEGNDSVQLSLTEDFSNAVNTLQVFGIGPEQNAGILTSGTYTIKFYFKATATLNVDLFSLTYGDAEACADTTYFATWKEYHEALANSITRLNQRGKACIDVQKAYQLAVMEKEGSDVNAVSGRLRDEQTGAALSNVSLIAKWMDNENNWQSRIVKTDDLGFYSIEYLPNNVTVYLDVIDGTGLSKTSVAVGDGDVNGFNLTMRSFNDSKTRVANISGDLVAYVEYVNGSLKNNQAAEMSLVVKNTGDEALSSAMIFVQMTDAAGNQKAILTLDSLLKGQSFAASVMPNGFSNNLQVLASGETAGTIQPGETVTIPVYWGGTLRPWDTASQDISVGILTEGSNEELDLTEMEASIRPDGVSDAKWSILWSRFTSIIGETWDSYIQALGEMQSYLSSVGSNVNDVTDLNQMLLLWAMDLVNPLGTLTSSTDNSVSNLSFSRTYTGGTVENRFADSDLGLGWDHNWNYSLVMDDDGNVSLNTPQGKAIRYQVNKSFSGKTIYRSLSETNMTLVRNADQTFTLTAIDNSVYSFSSDGRFTSMRDAKGNVITMAYTNGKLTSVTDTQNHSLIISWNEAGKIASVTDSHGNSTSYEYDATKSYLTQVTWSDGRTISYQYETEGNALSAMKSITYADGTHLYFSYDELGRIYESHSDNNV